MATPTCRRLCWPSTGQALASPSRCRPSSWGAGEYPLPDTIESEGWPALRHGLLASWCWACAQSPLSSACLTHLGTHRFKNADEGSKPTQPRPFPTLSIGVRLLIAPIIIFGPILVGAVRGLLAGLMVGGARLMGAGACWPV